MRPLALSPEHGTVEENYHQLLIYVHKYHEMREDYLRMTNTSVSIVGFSIQGFSRKSSFHLQELRVSILLIHSLGGTPLSKEKDNPSNINKSNWKMM